MAAVREHLIRPPLPLPAIVPLASCAAVQGSPERAVPATAAWLFLLLSLRWFDDAEDRDRTDDLWNTIGVARCTNFAAGAFALATDTLARAPADWVPRVALAEFTHFALELASGQDRDLCGQDATLHEYWETMRRKCGSVGALAARLGALHGTTNPHLLDACTEYGMHIGVLMQILDDIDGVFQPRGDGDLERGKSNFVLLTALRRPHRQRSALRAILERGDPRRAGAQIRKILDEMDARSVCVWAALQERDAALAAIRTCPGMQGVECLTSFADSLFGDIDNLIGRQSEVA